VGSPDNGEVIPAELAHSLEYVVTVGFGTPAIPQTVVVDSGSDFAWVQCKRLQRVRPPEGPPV